MGLSRGAGKCEFHGWDVVGDLHSLDGMDGMDGMIALVCIQGRGLTCGRMPD